MLVVISGSNIVYILFIIINSLCSAYVNFVKNKLAALCRKYSMLSICQPITLKNETVLQLIVDKEFI